ncbi:hypothetical protein K439DRAFT_1311774, partial [Ramaria rubella]
TLHPNATFPNIILALDFIGTNPLRFHWKLFVQRAGSDEGIKFRHGYWRIRTSQSVTTAAIIGNLGSHTLKEFGEVLSQVTVNVIPTSEAGRRLHAGGYINCPDVNALEAERWRLGEAAAYAIEDESFQFATLHV